MKLVAGRRVTSRIVDARRLDPADIVAGMYIATRLFGEANHSFQIMMVGATFGIEGAGRDRRLRAGVYVVGRGNTSRPFIVWPISKRWEIVYIYAGDYFEAITWDDHGTPMVAFAVGDK